MKIKNIFLGVFISACSCIIVAIEGQIEPEIEQLQEVVTTESPAERKNRWLERLDTRRLTQDPMQVHLEEVAKRLDLKGQPVKLKKSVTFNDSATQFVDPQFQPDFEKPTTLWGQLFGTKRIEYDVYDKTPKPVRRSNKDLQKREILQDDLDKRIAKRTQTDKKAQKRWQFQQDKEEPMTEEEIKGWWEENMSGKRAVERMSQKVTQEMLDEEIKKKMQEPLVAKNGILARPGSALQSRTFRQIK